jgi:hypothetical protein
MKRRRGPRPRAAATMHAVLDLTPGEQADRERRGDPFPPQPEWTDETLAVLSDTFDGGDHPVPVRRPGFTPADEAAAEYVGRFTQHIWGLARAGRFAEARRFALQWGTPSDPQYRPAPGSYPYPQRRETGPRPGYPAPYGRAEPFGLPSMPVHAPLPPMALAPVQERRAAVARYRLDRLRDHPACEHPEEYADWMRRVGTATGTHTLWEDAAAWPDKDVGDPPPARRGLAITAGPQQLPRRRPGTRGGRHAAGTPAQPGTRPHAPIPIDVLSRIRDRLASLPERRSA